MTTLLRIGFSNSNYIHCVKSVQIRSFSGPYFPAFGLNTERYSLSLHIQSECGKIRTTKNSIFGRFSRSDCIYFQIQLWSDTLLDFITSVYKRQSHVWLKHHENQLACMRTILGTIFFLLLVPLQ